MRNSFSSINELTGNAFQTRPIQQGEIRRLAVVAAVLNTYFIPDKEWKFSYCKGSLTFQHEIDNHRVIKIFVDYENRLSNRIPLQIGLEPIVIGIELGHEPAFSRQMIRNVLRRDFIYVDPEQGGEKYYLMPQNDHFYDIIFLRNGNCPYEVEEDLLSFYIEKISELISLEEEVS